MDYSSTGSNPFHCSTVLKWGGKEPANITTRNATTCVWYACIFSCHVVSDLCFILVGCPFHISHLGMIMVSGILPEYGMILTVVFDLCLKC